MARAKRTRGPSPKSAAPKPTSPLVARRVNILAEVVLAQLGAQPLAVQRAMVDALLARIRLHFAHLEVSL